MRVYEKGCGICEDPRVIVSMTKDEAAILLSELDAFDAYEQAGRMFTRVKARVRALVEPVAAEKKK